MERTLEETINDVVKIISDAFDAIETWEKLSPEEAGRQARVAYAENVGAYHLAQGNIQKYRVLDNGDLVFVPNKAVPYIKLEFYALPWGELFSEYDKKTKEEKS